MHCNARFLTAAIAAGTLLSSASAAPFANGGFEETPVAPPEMVESFTPVPFASTKVCPGPPPPGRIIQGNNNEICSGWVRSGPGVVTRSRGSSNGYLPPVKHARLSLSRTQGPLGIRRGRGYRRHRLVCRPVLPPPRGSVEKYANPPVAQSRGVWHATS